jgi:Lamin Tail Domain
MYTRSEEVAMPLARYGVLAGRVVDRRAEGGTDTPRRRRLAGRRPAAALPGSTPGGARGQAQWVAIFLAFQSQIWHPDDQTGHAISDPGPEPTAADRRLRIVAALVNPRGPAPEVETVTLLNAGPDEIDLAGWSIADQAKRRLVLDSAALPAGDAVRVVLAAPVQLGNRGGLVTLLDPDGLKVDGVAYTKGQAGAEGWRLVF